MMGGSSSLRLLLFVAALSIVWADHAAAPDGFPIVQANGASCVATSSFDDMCFVKSPEADTTSSTFCPMRPTILSGDTQLGDGAYAYARVRDSKIAVAPVQWLDYATTRCSSHKDNNGHGLQDDGRAPSSSWALGCLAPTGNIKDLKIAGVLRVNSGVVDVIVSPLSRFLSVTLFVRPDDRNPNHLSRRLLTRCSSPAYLSALPERLVF